MNMLGLRASAGEASDMTGVVGVWGHFGWERACVFQKKG